MPTLPTGIVVADPNHVSHHNSLHGFYNVLANLPRVSVRRSSSLSLNNATDTIVSWDVEEKDVGGMWSAGAPTRLVVPTAGDYFVVANFRFQGLANTGTVLADLLKNGSNQGSLFRAAAAVSEVSTGTGSFMLPNLAVNDYIELRVYQDNGGGASRNLEVFGQTPRFGMFMISTTF